MSQTIDVIIPTYNGLPYLKETVESVLAQTHKDIKVYVVDDGSTDKGQTKKYVASLKDPRVEYHHKTNGGQATARNHGIKLSISQYLTFVDSDDIWFPTKLERQLKLMQQQPRTGMVYGYHHFIDDSGAITGSLVISKRGQLTDALVKGNCIAGSGSMVMIRRSVFDKIGLFKEDLLIGEDWEMWLRIAQDFEVDYVPDFLAALRVHAEGMQKNYLKMADGLAYMLPTMLKELKFTPAQRRRLAQTCLEGAIEGYMNAHARGKARQALRKLLIYNPAYALRPRHWVSFGFYSRVTLSNPLYSGIKSKLAKALGKSEPNQD